MSYQKPYIVLVHGFLRSKKSMGRLGRFLERQGFEVVNVGYPFRRNGVVEITRRYLAPVVQGLEEDRPIHFVTHSLGGIIVRYFLAHTDINNFGRFVAISPPNHGSQTTAFLSRFAVFNWLLGPCLKDLSPGSEVLASLGKPDTKFGVIASTKDGKVSVAQARYSESEPLAIVERYHTFIMNAPEVMNLTSTFLKTGFFK